MDYLTTVICNKVANPFFYVPFPSGRHIVQFWNESIANQNTMADLMDHNSFEEFSMEVCRYKNGISAGICDSDPFHSCSVYQEVAITGYPDR